MTPELSVLFFYILYSIYHVAYKSIRTFSRMNTMIYYRIVSKNEGMENSTSNKDSKSRKAALRKNDYRIVKIESRESVETALSPVNNFRLFDATDVGFNGPLYLRNFFFYLFFNCHCELRQDFN